MKAIILEVKDGYAAALREDGLVVKTRKLAEVGQTVELDEKTVRFPKQGKRVARTAVAAALALAVTGGAYTYTNVAAASYVTLDTEETSVELSVNRMGRVVGVRALDEESSALAESLAADVRRMSVEDAVDAAMNRMGGASTVVAGVTGDTEKRAAEVQEAVERGAGRTERAAELVTLEISRDERREAGERSMSAGRWAFERGGGRWRDEGDDFDDDDFDDDRPPFVPSNGGASANQTLDNGSAPVTPSGGDDAPPAPPASGGAPAGRPPRMERGDDDGDRDDWDDWNGGDDDDRRMSQDGVSPQATPEQDTQPPDNTQDGGQTPPNVAESRQTPPEGAPFAAAPNGGMQPPRMDGMNGGSGRMPDGGFPGR